MDLDASALTKKTEKTSKAMNIEKNALEGITASMEKDATKNPVGKRVKQDTKQAPGKTAKKIPGIHKGPSGQKEPERKKTGQEKQRRGKKVVHDNSKRAI